MMGLVASLRGQAASASKIDESFALVARQGLQSAKAFLKHSIIRAGLEAVSYSGAPRLFPSFGGRGLIFTLHHIRPGGTSDFAPNAGLSVTPDFLEQAILACRECGLAAVHLHDIPELLSDPDDRRNFVAFTLDDGYRNNAEFAAPIFRKFDIPYTIFITAGFVERTRTLWWETAEALIANAEGFEFDFGSGRKEVEVATVGQKRQAFSRLAGFVDAFDEDEAVARIDEAARTVGIDPTAIVRNLVMDETELRVLSEDKLVHFGAHTLTHVNLRRVGEDRLHDEIDKSACAVERYVGRVPRSFSYPYGWRSAAGDREARAAAEAGFAAAVTTQPGVLTPDIIARPTFLPRVSLNGLFQRKRYVKALISGIPFKLTAQ